MRKMFISGILLLAASSAIAKDKPLSFPTRDVALEIKTVMAEGVVQQISQRYYLASEQKSRDAPSGMNMYLLIDHKAHVMFTVYLGQPPTYLSAPYPEDDTEYVRTGKSERIAGNECLVWQTPVIVKKHSAAGYPGQPATYSIKITDCITADGVSLKQIIETNMNGQLSRVITEATKVNYSPQNPAFFRLPVGSLRKQLP